MTSNNLDTRIDSFIYTARKYKSLTEALPVNYNKVTDIEFVKQESYHALYVRLMALRKYFTTVSHKQVYLPSVMTDAKNKYPNVSNFINELDCNFSKAIAQEITQVLPNGENLNIIEVADLVVYGIYLHADEKKIKNLNQIDEAHLIFCVEKFVKPVEEVVLKLLELLESITVQNETNNSKPQSIVRIGKDSGSRIQSEEWQHLNAKEVFDEEAISSISNYSEEERNILEIASAFLSILYELSLTDENVNILRQMITPCTTDDWGNFFEIKAGLTSFPDYGIASKVHFNEKRTVASVNLIINIDKSIQIESDQLLSSGVIVLTFVKEPSQIGPWSIFAIGDAIDPYKCEK